MSNEPPHKPPDDDRDSFEFSAWGFKVRANPSATEYAQPESLKELGKNVLGHLYQLVEFPFAAVSAVTAGSLNIVNGICSVFVRPSTRDYEEAAEAVEGKRQAALEAEPEIEHEIKVVEFNGQEFDLSKNSEALADILQRFRDKGLSVVIRNLGGGRAALLIVREEFIETADEILTKKFLPALESDQNPPSSTSEFLVANLDLTPRVLKGLASIGVKTVGQLVEMSAPELMAVKGLGPASVDEIRGQLMYLGLRLRGE